MEAAESKQRKRVRHILDRLEEFQRDPCEDLLQKATVMSSRTIAAPRIRNLDAYTAPSKPQHLRLSRSKAPAKRIRKQTELVLGAPKSERTTSKDDNKGDISFPTISRVGGGAALGTVIGTAIVPGAGTIAGVVLGGVVGAFAPSILRYKTRR